jgi:hypothetical protein
LALAAAVFFVLASRSYETDAARNQARSPEDRSTPFSAANQPT